MHLAAQPDGALIRGEVHYHGQTPAAGLTVIAFDDAGEEIGQAKTDDQGKFTLQARFRCDHRLLVQTADGHGAEFTVKADLLPPSLPVRTPADEPAKASKDPPPHDDHPNETHHHHEATTDSEQLESIR